MQLGTEGLTVLVTGGTRGIGAAIVTSFLEEGANVAYCARSVPDATQFDEVAKARGVKAFGTAVDVCDRDALVRWVQDSKEQFGSIDVVVPNVSALNMTDFTVGFQTDFLSVVHLVEAALPHLAASKARGHGNVVAIGSISGHELDFSAGGPYGVFKAALTHYVQGQARLNAPAEKGHVRFNTVSPGHIYFENGIWGQIEREQPDFFKQALEMNPTGRMGRPEEIASAVVFLASAASAWTTGANLIIDGANTKGVAF